MQERKNRAQRLLDNVPKGTIVKTLFARLTEETAIIFTRQAIRQELRTAAAGAQEAADTADRLMLLDAQGREIPLQELTEAKRDLRLKLAKVKRLEHDLAAVKDL